MWTACTATIEYAVEVLKVKHAILCGHSDCGAMKAALDRKGLENLPKASRWLHHVEAAFSHRQPLNPADGRACRTGRADPRQRGGAAAKPEGAAGGGAGSGPRGRSRVHGWYYDILTGRIEFYDQQIRRFLPLVG